MANHARGDNDRSRSVADKRASLVGDAGVAGKRSRLAGSQPRAYSHGDQVGGSRRREADGRWVDRGSEPPRPPKKSGPPSLGEFVRDNSTYILSVAAVVAIVALLIFGINAIAGFSSRAVPQNPDEYTSPYDWSKLDRTNGRYAYVVNGQVKSRLGVDVSDHEGVIDWNAAANDGIDFAMIRVGYRGATEGELHADEQYEANMAGAKAAGVDCGVFFFSQAVNEQEAIEEADYVLATLGGQKLEYPIAFDSEVVAGVEGARTASLSDEELTAVSDAFCDRIERAGYRTLVYGNAYDLRNYTEVALAGRNIWWAEYNVEEPSHYRDIVIWQYTADGQVAGIESAVDLNIDLTGVV